MLRTIWKRAWYPLLLVCAVAGIFSVVFNNVHSPKGNVQPQMARFEPPDIPVGESWVAPLKTWISDYVPGQSRTQTIKVHAPAVYTMYRDVSTVVGDNGTLGLVLDNPLLLDGKSAFMVKSEYPGEAPKLKTYDPNTRTAIVTGFAPIQLTRTVEFAYVPDHVQLKLCYGDPMGTDSGRELVNDRDFAPAPEGARRWVSLSDDIQIVLFGSSLVTTVPPMATKDIAVTLYVPEGSSLPDNWEFRVSVGGYLGVINSGALNVGAEVNCKFLVSSTELKLK